MSDAFSPPTWRPIAAAIVHYQERAWLGMFAPAGTARPIIDKLNAEITKVLRAPGIKETFEAQGPVPLCRHPSSCRNAQARNRHLGPM